MRDGWRASFFVFGAVGLTWGAAWYAWFRDSPLEKAGVSLMLSSLPYVMPPPRTLPAALRMGRTWGRRTLGIAGLGVALLLVGTLLWFRIDAAPDVSAGLPHPAPSPAGAAQS